MKLKLDSKDELYENTTNPIHKQSLHSDVNNIDIDSTLENPSGSIHDDSHDINSGNFLVSPPWVQDPDIQRGKVEFLSHEEEIFWNRLIKKYLYPLDEDKKQIEKTADALKTLRNEFLFKFFMLNALFVLTVFLMQLNKDTLHFQWPLGLSYNITYHRDTIEVICTKLKSSRLSFIINRNLMYRFILKKIIYNLNQSVVYLSSDSC